MVDIVDKQPIFWALRKTVDTDSAIYIPIPKLKISYKISLIPISYNSYTKIKPFQK